MSIQHKAFAEYIPSVQRMARSYHRKLPGWFDVEDLIGEGMIGLIEASKTFDSQRGVPFLAFASRRIFGAMKDFISKHDTMSKLDRRAANAAKELELEYVAVKTTPLTDNPLEQGESATLPDLFGRKSSRPDHVVAAQFDLHRIKSQLAEQHWNILVEVQVTGLSFKDLSTRLKMNEVQVVLLYNTALQQARKVALQQRGKATSAA